MSASTLLSLALLLLLLATAYCKRNNSCTTNELRNCLCTYGKYDYHELQHIVNCTDQHFTDTGVLKFLPSETQVLIFTGNNIPELPWNVFGTLNDLKDLRVIDMSNNNIREIRGKSYHHVTNVERLILNHNNITVSSQDLDGNHHHPRIFSNFVNLLELHLTNAFADNTDEALANDLHDIFVNSNLTHLIKIHLEQNEIRAFRDPNVFCDLPELSDLYLGDNLLNAVNFNIECIKKLRFIDLERNRFVSFLNRDLEKFDHLAYPVRKETEPLMIEIRKNPLQCNKCYSLNQWLHKTNVSVRGKEQLTCENDKNIEKSLFYLFDDAHYLSMKGTENGSKTVTALIVLLCFTLFVLISALIYVSWDQIKPKLTPLYESVSRKVHYTTIESQPDHV